MDLREAQTPKGRCRARSSGALLLNLYIRALVISLRLCPRLDQTHYMPPATSFESRTHLLQFLLLAPFLQQVYAAKRRFIGRIGLDGKCHECVLESILNLGLMYFAEYSTLTNAVIDMRYCRKKLPVWVTLLIVIGGSFSSLSSSFLRPGTDHRASHCVDPRHRAGSLLVQALQEARASYAEF